MSATNRGAERRELDRYYTPLDAARALVRTLDLEDVHRVVEPSVGGGAFIRALAMAAPDRRLHTVGVDLDPAAEGFRYVDTAIAGDWLRIDVGEAPDLVVGNPPFGRVEEDAQGRPTGRRNKDGKLVTEACAELHVRRALAVVRYGGTVAFLLRAAFMESLERGRFWDEHDSDLVEARMLRERPSFTGGGNDNCMYAWFVFRRGYQGAARLVPCWSWKGAGARQEEGLFAR